MFRWSIPRDWLVGWENLCCYLIPFPFPFPFRAICQFRPFVNLGHLSWGGDYHNRLAEKTQSCQTLQGLAWQSLVLEHVMVRDRRQSDIQTAWREISRIVLRIVINIEARQGKSLQGMSLSIVSRSSVLSSFSNATRLWEEGLYKQWLYQQCPDVQLYHNCEV